MDTLKKIAESKIFNPFRQSTSNQQSIRGEAFSRGTSGKTSKASRTGTAASAGANRPISPSQKALNEVKVLLDEYQKDLDENFPGDPEGWIKSRVLDARLDPPKE
jgi:hypothetical protein